MADVKTNDIAKRSQVHHYMNLGTAEAPQWERMGKGWKKFSENPNAQTDGVQYGSLEELLALRPDYLVEAASPACMKAITFPTLAAGCSIVTLSIGAFADDAFYAEAAEAARKAGRRIYLASGATGGFDVLRTATLMGGATAEFFNEKGPNGLRGTDVYDESLHSEQRVVFRGTAKEAIAKFPTRVNVTVAASRASVGPDNLKVTMQSSPYFRGDTQRVEIRNSEVRAVVDVYSATPAIAAWSVVAVLQNITSPIVF